MDPRNILVVEDHPLMAEAVALALARLEHKPKVTRAGDLESAFEQVASGPQPDLVLLDLGLPGCTGLEALERFRERFPGVGVVVLSGDESGKTILAALDRGAMGYIPKRSSENVLLNAIKLVGAGGIYVPTEALRETPAHVPAPASAAVDLSPRQKEVLGLLLKGLPNKLIARKLDISENTTKVHVSAVLHALGVGTRTQALIAASRLGLRLDS
jgi:DNA-binding NarL/FixJ family response regulator